MRCEGPIPQHIFRRLQNQHRLEQQQPRKNNGASSLGDDFVTYSSSERSSNDGKISLCVEFKANGYCRFGDACKYAHSYDELQLAKPRGKCNPRYKTRHCDKFSSTGYCKYGDKCQYIHYLQNENIRKQRESRGVAMNINERPLKSYGWQLQHGGGLNSTVDERMNVTMDGSSGQLGKYSDVEKWTPFSKQRWGFQIEEQLNASLPILLSSIDSVSIGASFKYSKYNNVDEKWTPFSKQSWAFQIEEQLNASLPELLPSIDSSIQASFNSLLSDGSQH